MDGEAESRRVRWRSRRGMLEMDLVLEPSAAECYPRLNDGDRRGYRRLLECEDRDLYAWFVGRVIPRDGELARIVARVLDYTRAAA